MVSGRVTVRVRVRRPDSSGNLLIWRKMDYAPLTLPLDRLNATFYAS